MNLRAIRNFEAVAPVSYFTQALELAENSDPAALRSAVDRAYYAAFLTARDEMSGKLYGSFVAGSAAHTQVSKALYNLDEDAGEKLIALRRVRNRLTYQTDQYTLARGQSLSDLLEAARSVIETVGSLPANP